MGFKERLTKEWLFWDGGTGSVLQSWGLQAGELPETWNINHPEKIVELNKGYLEAGCDIINTNTGVSIDYSTGKVVTLKQPGLYHVDLQATVAPTAAGFTLTTRRASRTSARVRRTTLAACA